MKKSHFFLGLIMGVAAGLFLQTKDGKKMTADALKKAKVLQKQVMKKIASIEELTKDKYEEIVDEVMAYYAKAKDVAETEVPEVRKYLLGRWKEIEATLTEPAE